MSSTKILYRAWNTYQSSWLYCYASSNINEALILLRARALKKVGKCNINRIEKKEDDVWKNLSMPIGYQGF